MELAGIAERKMPELYQPHQCVGMISSEAAGRTGYSRKVKVYAGMGDAGATTLASGITSPGECNINLGTSGWVATVSGDIFDSAKGVFNLAAFREQAYINVVPFLNAGNVHKWISGILSPKEEDGSTDYASLSKRMEEVPAGSSGVVFLPYLNGERFPVMDTQVKGTSLGITPETRWGDLARSCLEGVAFSIRQGIEQIGVKPGKISVIGGGGRVALWNRILANVLKQNVYVYRHSDILPSLALVSAVLLEQGEIADYSAFTEKLQGEEYSVKYEPQQQEASVYDRLYEQYRRAYPAVKGYYHDSAI